MMDARDASAERLIPHRGGMLWIDRVLHCDAQRVVAEATVRMDHLLADEDAPGLPAWMGIEYMAQGIAAWAGGRALARGEEIKPGFLLGTRRYEAHRPWLAFGLRLRIECECELMGDNGLGLFACKLLDGETELAIANVSVFEPPSPDDYLNDPNS